MLQQRPIVHIEETSFTCNDNDNDNDDDDEERELMRGMCVYLFL